DLRIDDVKHGTERWRPALCRYGRPHAVSVRRRLPTSGDAAGRRACERTAAAAGACGSAPATAAPARVEAQAVIDGACGTRTAAGVKCPFLLRSGRLVGAEPDRMKKPCAPT